MSIISFLKLREHFNLSWIIKLSSILDEADKIYLPYNVKLKNQLQFHNVLFHFVFNMEKSLRPNH